MKRVENESLETVHTHTHTHTHTDILKNKKGLTLVALVVTIIILLILAGITILQLAESGLLENAKLAQQKSENAQEKEEGILADYENKIGEYVGSNREMVTVDKAQYEQLLQDVQDLKSNITYNAGDTALIKSCVLPGCLSNSGKNILFSIALGKNISSDVTEIEFSTVGFGIRHAGGGYLINSANLSTGADISDYFSVYKVDQNYITFIYEASTAITGSGTPINNTPLAIQLYRLTINFK